MKNELEYIRKKYIKPYPRYCYSNQSVADLLLEVLNNATPSNRPDFYYLKNNTCYICEHFQFDASKTTRKGSSFKRAEKNADRQIDKKTISVLKSTKYNNDSVTNCGSFYENIECSQNKYFWKDNFIKNFESHYLNLKEYQENLIQQNIINKHTKIKNIFVIEDTTELGAFLSKDSNSVCYPISFEFGIKLINNATAIDYVIFLNSTTKVMVFTHKNEYKDMKTKFNFSKTEMFFFNNISKITSIVAIPKQLLKK